MHARWALSPHLLALLALFLGPTSVLRAQATGDVVRDRVQPESPGDRYRAIVDSYRNGRTTEAIEALLLLGPDGLDVANPDAQKPTHPTERWIRAAAMLHTDAAETLWVVDENQAKRHIRAGRRWADLASPLSPSFRPQWYLAAGLLLVDLAGQGSGVQFALDHFDDACRSMPDDAPLLIAAAWLWERTALWPVSLTWDPRRQRVSKHDRLVRAARYAEAAADADPSSIESLLRLARLRTLLGERAQARSALESLIARNDLVSRDAYLARLFLGRILEGSAETASEAAELFAQAIGLVPSGQAARLALARLLHASGDGRTAAARIAPALSTEHGSEDDPWLDYLSGHPKAGASLRHALRAEAQTER